MSIVLIVLIGCVAILAFDALAGLIARLTPIRYEWMAPGSFAIYLVTGFFAAAATGSLAVAATAGAASQPDLHAAEKTCAAHGSLCYT